MNHLFGIVCESMPLITVVILLALLAVPKRLSATLRHQALVVAALLSLAAPFLQRAMPDWRVLPRLADLPVMGWVAVAPSPVLHETAAGRGSARSTTQVAAAPAEASRNVWRPWFRAAAVVWLAGVAWALVRLGYHGLALRRCVRTSLPASAEIRLLASAIAGKPVRVRVIGGGGDAFACGLISPTIVLPTTVLRLPEEQLRMILEHELAHLRRLDPLWAWVLEGFLAVYWFHPLAWVLVKRSHLVREMATDDLVLLGGRSAEAYASCLGSAALRAGQLAAPPIPALAFARQHPVLTRLHAILDATRNRTTPSVGAWLATGMPMVAPALLVASLGFKAASEAQPVHRVVKRDLSSHDQTPSLWSDLIEPMVDAALPERQPGDARFHAAMAVSLPNDHRLASPRAGSDSSNPGSTQTADPSPSYPDADLSGAPIRASRDDSMTPPSLASGAVRSSIPGFSRPGAGHPLPPDSPSHSPGPGPSLKPVRPILPVSPTVPSPLPADPEPTVDSGPRVGTPPNGGDDQGGAPSLADNGSETPGPVETNSPGETATPGEAAIPIVSGGFQGVEGFPDSTQGSGVQAPALEIVPYTSEAGRHFAISWTVPEAEAGIWFPEASPDLVSWSSSATTLIFQGPVPATDGTVRFYAAIREPMPHSHFRFLRLAASSNGMPAETAKE